MTRSILLLGMLITSTIAFAQNGATKAPSVSEYLQLAGQMKEAGDIREATRYLNQAATIEWEKKNYTDAITYFNQSIELNEQINNQSGISKINSNLGMIYADLQQYQKSLEQFRLSLNYREKFGEKAEVISCRINIGVVLNNLKNYREAAENIEVALALATEMNDANQMKACYGMLTETYEKAGNQELTQYYFNLYRTFHEMLQRNKLSEANKETRSAQLKALMTDLEIKQKEIELLKTTSELKKVEEELTELSKEAQSLIANNTKQELALSLLEREAELNALRIHKAESAGRFKNMIIAIIAIGLLATATILLILYRNFKYKKGMNNQLIRQNEEIKALMNSLETTRRPFIQNLEPPLSGKLFIPQTETLTQ
jgi:tetratricopeptide (TPR) repeat protein